MSDPLEVLRSEPEPVPPDPDFALRLRARVARALDLPPGVSPTTTHTSDLTTAAATTSQRPAAIPYLAVRGAAEAIEWYCSVLGAEVNGDPIVMADGRVGHCELGLSGGVLYLSEEHPELGVVAPVPGAAAVSLVLAVDDTDAVRARVLANGGSTDRDVYDGYGHRNAWVVDAYGHRWLLRGPVPAPHAARPIGAGDVGYLMWRTPDAAQAEAFYTAVLGWQCQPGATPQGRNVTSTSIPTGIYGGATYSGVWCCYAVASVEAAAAAVRDRGGRVLDVRDEAYGRVADCLDDQGVEFSVYEPAEDATRPALNGEHRGDVSYLTYEFTDGERGQAFYRAVLGVGEDERRPMAGTASGRDNVVVAMWRVDDIADAVARVVAAGGTAGEVQQRPYGLASECVDDQGGRFWLGQH